MMYRTVTIGMLCPHCGFNNKLSDYNTVLDDHVIAVPAFISPLKERKYACERCGGDMGTNANRAIYTIDAEKTRYPKSVYRTHAHEQLGIVSPSLLYDLKSGKFGSEPLRKYWEAEAERIKQMVNLRTCGRSDWKRLQGLLRVLSSDYLGTLARQLDKILDALIPAIVKAAEAINSLVEDSTNISHALTDWMTVYREGAE